MSKPLKLTLACLALLLLLIPAALLGLLSTDAGTRLVGKQLQRSLGDSLHWQHMQGALSGPLHITGLRYSQPGLSASAKQVVLDWDPTALLAGQLRVAKLSVDGLSLSFTSEDSKTASPPFSPADIQIPVNISIANAQLTQVQIIQGEKNLRVDDIQLKARLNGQELLIEAFHLSSADADLQLGGSLLLDDHMPLDIHTRWTWKKPESAPVSGAAQLTGDINWRQATSFDLEYGLNATGLSVLEEELPNQLALQGVARGSYQGNALALSQLTLARSDSELALDVSGTAAGLDGDSPTLDHTVRWSGLRWPLDAGIARFASPIGELSIRGPLQDYALDIALTLDGADIPRGVWSARGQGNLSSLQLQQLQGELLQGELTAHGQVAWSPRPKWQLQLNAREINPQALLQQLPGSISADLAIHGETDPHQRLQAQLELQGIYGHLAGYPLEASGSANIAGDRLEISRLTLNSGRNQVQVSGAVASEAMDIDWRLQALAPGELLPGAGGTVRGTGHIAGSPQAPMLSGRLHGEQLQLDTLQSGVLDLAFAAGTHPGDSLQIQLSAGPVAVQDKLVLDSLNIKASGSNTRHTLALSAERGGEQLAGTMVGGLTAGLDGWQGAIQALQLNTGQWGQWLQGQAVPLELSAETASLGDLCLQRVDGPGELCLAGSWSAEAESTLSLKADALPLSLWQPTLGGDIQARLSGSLAADGNIVAAGALALSPGQIQLASPGQRPLNHGGGNLDFAIDSQGLTAKLDFIAPENGTLTGRLAMPDLHSLPLVEQQAVEARVLAALPDLSGLAAWVPELSATGGSVNADMQLAGTLAQPRLNGVVALSNGYADLPSTGMQLRDTQLRINSSEERPGILEISGLAASGDGHLLLFGLLDPARQQLDIELAGDSFQVYNTRDARVAIAPDLRIKWLDNTLLLRGEVLVPEAEITPTLELNPAVSSEDDSSPGTSGQVIAPSADVVIIDGAGEGPEQEEFAAPFRIDNKLRLRLGRRVNVKALGFMGRISGEVLFTNSPQQKDLVPIASGKLSVENGTFRSFGQDLDIRTGELLFNNQPATEPEINLRAVRWIDNDPQVSSAGILLTGPITSPTMELFSRPQLETSEVQSYLLTGRSTGDRNSVLSIGTYVSPRIYVGYGYNTLEKTSEFNSLFTITPRYGVGLDVGEADNNLNMTFTYEH